MVEELDLTKLINLFDNTTASYKFYFFKSILYFMKQQKIKINLEDIVKQMIIGAWYSVSTYNLTLGKNDNLQKIILELKNEFNVKDNISQLDLEKLINSIELKNKYYSIINMVPYRLLSVFYAKQNKNESDISYHKRIINSSKQQNNAFYSFEQNLIVNTNKIILNKLWLTYINEHRVLIDGWINYKLIQFLEIRNPNVPNISRKLLLNKRSSLTTERKLYAEIFSNLAINDIYLSNQKIIMEKHIDLDHFLPWTYVMHNNIWNLVPTNKLTNISKSNKLPHKKYFNEFTKIQYEIFKYCVTHKKIGYLEQYKLIYKELDIEKINNNNYEINQEEFSNNLHHVIDAMWETAKNNGFKVWNE